MNSAVDIFYDGNAYNKNLINSIHIIIVRNEKYLKCTIFV